ncbi:MAG: hypothetical protein ACOYUZ_00285 [Patescibacteria group bacterium]
MKNNYVQRFGGISILLFVFLVLGAGCLEADKGQMVKDEGGRQDVNEVDVGDVLPNNGQMLGGDRDEHGCIGSAGYSWCESLQKCYRPWEEKCEEVKVEADNVPKPDVEDDYGGEYPATIYGFYDDNNQQKTDCYYFENAIYTGYDILTELAKNNYSYDSVFADQVYYTPENSLALKNQIADELAKMGKKFRSVSACHLADGLDAVSGVIWDKERSWEEPFYKTESEARRQYLDDMEDGYRLLIIKDGKVAIVNDLLMRDPTFTGGDVSSCRAELKGKNVTWECIAYFDRTDNGFDNIVHKIWTISPEGKILSIDEEVED